jgi:plastocyanin
MQTNKNKLWILLGVIVVIVIIIIVAAFQGRQAAKIPAVETNSPTPGENNPGVVTDASVSAANNDLQAAPNAAAITSLNDAKVVVPGANPITTDNKVVTAEGQATNNAAAPMSPEAPHQTGFLDKVTLPKTLTQINVGNDKFTPSEFTTKAGAPTSFSLTSVNNYSHVITFDDPSLSAVAILVGPGQTKAITFNAPTTPGTYTFRCASPDHAAKGEIGKMIVK